MKTLTFGAYISWQIASAEASESNFEYIEKEHIFVGLLSLEKLINLKDGEAFKQKDLIDLKKENDELDLIFNELNINPTKLRRNIRQKLGSGDNEKNENVMHRSIECKNVFEKAFDYSKDEKVSCLELLIALLNNSEGILNEIIIESSIDIVKFRNTVINFIEKKISDNGDNDLKYLEKYGRDLTKEAKERKLGPIIGRRNELLKVIQTLARNTKNNPVLIGDAGVGKTAVVEALAIRIVQGKNPEILKDKRIIELKISSLVAGTKYRGEFEDRLNQILKEAKSNPEIILFIDEIHTIIGAGNSEGNLDAANILKPELARGEIKCIGATTIDEYRKYIEKDSALERRFDKIIVDEPTFSETLEILKGLKDKLESHHKVKISDEALKAAINISIRFDTDHRLPDKAIDLIDKASAKTRIPSLSIYEGNLTSSGEIRKKEVTNITVAEILSEKMDIPVEVILGYVEGVEESKFSELEVELKKCIIGQDEAIERVTKRLLIAHSGIRNRTKPLAIFLFLGPTGVGKTELTKLIATSIFGNASHLIRLDMSEYKEEHSLSKLIGSPPGYVGYEEEGQLTGKIRTKPYSVVLLDEIEKAHPRIFDLFLQVFDEGRITDSKGRIIDTKNTIFILTSNIVLKKKKEFGFKQENSPSLLDEEKLKTFFRAEFLNRIDEIISFNNLTLDNIINIADIQFKNLKKSLHQKYKITLKYEKDVIEFIADKGFSNEYGARNLQRTFENLIEYPISELIAKRKLIKNILIRLTNNEHKELEFVGDEFIMPSQGGP